MTIYFLKYFLHRVWLACEHPMPMKREMEQPWEATPGAALWVSLPSEVNNFML